jgi:hypothetical protein
MSQSCAVAPRPDCVRQQRSSKIVSNQWGGQQQFGVQGGQLAPSQGPITGVICDEEITATFCNVQPARTLMATDQAAGPDQGAAQAAIPPPSRRARKNRPPTSCATDKINSYAVIAHSDLFSVGSKRRRTLAMFAIEAEKRPRKRNEI